MDFQSSATRVNPPTFSRWLFSARIPEKLVCSYRKCQPTNEGCRIPYVAIKNLNHRKCIANTIDNTTACRISTMEDIINKPHENKQELYVE